jgi:ABC-type multidrug transport system fused ATPase/permease subunit
MVASLAIVPLVVTTFEPRLLVMAAVAMVVVMVVAAMLRTIARRLEERSADAYAAVLDRLNGTIDGRLEIVARAGEDGVSRDFDAQLDGYARVARRAAFGRIFVGRAPLAAGALAVALVVAVDAPSRAAIEGAFLTKALLLAVSVPALHGVVLGFHGMLRTVVLVSPLIALLCQEAFQGGERGGQKVELPLAVSGRELAFSYGDHGTLAFADVSFDWEPREPLVLTGPNGAGKSTLLRLLLGLRPPSAGVIAFGGIDLRSVDLVHLRRQTAFLPQRPYLGEAHGTVRAALTFAAPTASSAEMRAALERTGVLAALRGHASEELDTPVGELSAGQRQRVALARILLQNARMVLLDEPDANLDASGIELVASLVRELTARGTMVAIAAHTAELATLSTKGRLELPARPSRAR